ncbi:hypothetical protein ZIOFF_035110 [Zingiber officinale]|uniref:Uncharacterized protein n=1 Tax=Zingiber officinale TaxID=94328 RepID=A0A8J5GGB9_ZINOF|nr:hypothetical protein ZIOFF_035110 [Zingiber officinale]
MSDVWEFKDGVMRIVEMENLGGRRPQQLLVYLQTEELITSHQMLEDRLRDEGRVHYPEMSSELIQYHSAPTPHPLAYPLAFGVRPRQLLIYLQIEELIISHQMLEDRLRDEGWVYYPEMLPELIQYHKGTDDNYLISLTRDFSSFSLIISI